jgi:hypothetical protein
VVNNVVQAADQVIYLTAAQLAQTTFVAGTTTSDDLFVNVAEGSHWAGSKEFHVNVPAPQPPVLTATNVSASRGQVLAASSLFTTTDPNNEPLTYAFYDNTPDATSGHFVVNGVAQAANQVIYLTAAQLAQTTFVAGTTTSDDLFVNVAEGSQWAGSKEFHVNVPAPPAAQAPVLTAANVSASNGQVFVASSLFTTTDPNNDPLTYAFYDNTPDAGSGHFVVNNVVQAADQVIYLTAAQLAQTTFVAGATTSDDLFVNVADGSMWAGSEEFHVNVPGSSQGTASLTETTLPLAGSTDGGGESFDAPTPNVALLGQYMASAFPHSGSGDSGTSPVCGFADPGPRQLFAPPAGSQSQHA